jgi:hypothetical protein
MFMMFTKFEKLSVPERSRRVKCEATLVPEAKVRTL